MALVGDAYAYFDRKFYALTVPIADLERIHTGCRWAEGPVWFADGGYLVWSDIPNNRLLRYLPDHGVSVFRADANYINGNTRDREGRLVSCSHGARALMRTEWDGTLTVLADRYQGKRLNSPNDVVVKSDGTIWFTDPTYGILSDYEGYKAEPEQAGCFVFRFDPATGSLSVVADDFVKPNGLAFSPDESTLYIADSGRSHDPDAPGHIRAFSVSETNRLSGGAVFASLEKDLFDGFRVDVEGHVWASAGAGINCYEPGGALLGRIKAPQMVSNLCFGGPRRNQLFFTATHEVYSVFLGVSGCQRP